MRTLPGLKKLVSAAALAVLVPFLASCSSSVTSISTGLSPLWVVGWGNSPENALTTAENPGGSEQSFRMFFYPTTSGTQERVHLSNFFGTTPLTVGAARLAVATTGTAIDPARDKPLTFNGSTTVTIAPGQSVVSDAVNIPFTFGGKMAVTMYLQGTFPSLTQHDTQVSNNYATPVGTGDKTTDSSGATFTNVVPEWFLLSGMDFYGQYQGTVILFGSSSIDGHNSNFGNTNVYPTPNVAVSGQDNDRPSDWLARQLVAAGYSAGVLNAGVLADPAGTPINPTPGVTSGVEREDRDVLHQPGARTVIIYFGGIDIREAECRSAPAIEASLTTIISQATAAGLHSILATLPPAAYCSNAAAANYGPIPTAAAPFAGDINPGPENPGSAQRNILNTWIRTVGPTLPGVVAIADFDKALHDPVHPDFLLDSINSGDNFHPNGVGYGIQSSAIPLSSIFAQ